MKNGLMDVFRRTGHLLAALCLMAAIVLSVCTGYVSASLNSCSASISPSTTAPSEDTSAVFGIYNSSDTDINWIKISSPGPQYATVVSASAYQWQGNTTSQDATYTTGTLSAGDSRNFSLEFMSGGSPAANVNWTVQVSNDASGANPITCDGNLSMSIQIQPSVITISNITLSNLSSSGVTIAWDTDIASTSQIRYGKDDSYGQSSSLDTNLKTSHSMTLKNLSPNTGYHFQVESDTPADGGTSTSGDSTFLTAIKESLIVSQVPAQKAPALGVPVTIPGDKIPPTISLDNLNGSIFKTTPRISGQATDDTAVARIEYSTNDGGSWLPADAVGIGTKKVTFAFQPLNLDDGNYSILARAIDAGGNITNSKKLAIVIDQLPPTVGGSVLNFGPQIMNNATNLTTLTGIDQKITLSAVGGPTSISITARGNEAGKQKVFTLTRSSDSGLWSGVLSFEKPGSYSLDIQSEDGAGNQSLRHFEYVTVKPAGRVLQQGKNTPLSAQVTVYYFEPESRQWVQWDGETYGQQNPQQTDKNGSFSLMLPAGKYYLRASAKGFASKNSSIITTKTLTPITESMHLRKTGGLHFGSLNLSWPDYASENMNVVSDKTAASKLDGTILPTFSLMDINGAKVNSIDWLGKPTLIDVTSIWSPSTSDQLPALDELAKTGDINVVPIGLQENAGSLKSYNSISGYRLNWLADPTNSLAGKMDINGLPTHIFVDRTGKIRHIQSGVMSKQQLRSGLVNL